MAIVLTNRIAISARATNDHSGIRVSEDIGSQWTSSTRRASDDDGVNGWRERVARASLGPEWRYVDDTRVALGRASRPPC